MRPMSKQLRIVALTLGIVAVGGSVADHRLRRAGETGRELERGTPPADPERLSVDDPRSPHLTPGFARALGSPDAFDSPAAEVVEPPKGPSLRLFGTVSYEGEQSTIRPALLRLVDPGWEFRTAHADTWYSFEDLQPGSWSSR